MKLQLLCPFRGGQNPYAQEADFNTSCWLNQFSLIRNYQELLHNSQGKFTMMVARMFPNADLNTLCIAAEFNALLFLIDDYFDAGENSGSKKLKFQSFIDHLIEILDNREEKKTVKNPILAAFSDLWGRMKIISNREWQKRFSESLKQALQANVWRMEVVDSQRLPSLEEYLYYRPMIGGANFFAYLLEIMERICLPPLVFELADVQQMIKLCSETICLANDVFSFEKELAQGDEMNLIMLVKRERSLSIEDAVHDATMIHNQGVQEFLRLMYNRPECGNPSLERDIFKYCRALGTMMRGNIDWSTKDTERYNYVSPVKPSPLLTLKHC